MSEYRIVVKIDPQTGPGAQTVKRDLEGIKGAADKQSEGLSKVKDSFASLQKQVAEGTISTEKYNRELASLARQAEVLSTAQRRTADTTSQVGKATASATATVAGLLGATRNAAAETARSNQGLTRAKDLYTQVGFSVRDLAGVMVTATGTTNNFTSATNRAAGGGGGGGPPGGGGLGGLRGAAGMAAGMLGGAFGLALAAGASLLVDFAMKAFAGEESIDDLVEAMKKEAEQQDRSRAAKEAYGQTMEGLTRTVRTQTEAIAELFKANQTQTEQQREQVRQTALAIDARAAETRGLIEQARALLEINEIRSRSGGAQQMDMAVASTQRSSARLAELEKRLANINTESTTAWSNYEQLLAMSVADEAARLTDPLEKIKDTYGNSTSGLIGAATAAATAEEVRNGTLRRQIDLLKAAQKAEEDRYRASQRKPATTSDGVSRFRSREQAIGMAGRELQGQGLRVDGNTQFGYTGGHANNADHNKYAIDVNVGKGVVEADVPDMKARFDQLALSYQRRGFNVIWNGQKYNAFGNGPSGPAKGHREHFHVYAPEVIVGKPTGASTAAQEARDFKAGESAEEKLRRLVAAKADFVSGIENKAAKVGLPEDRKTQLAANIEGQLAEYKRRFETAASPEEVKRITGALTEADARAQAEHFREAYQYPLENLQMALGQTGLQREIYNRILEETKLKGEALDPIEKGMIENSVIQTDKYERLGAILQDIHQPLEDYRQTIAALNEGLKMGSISQNEFNARVGELGATTRGMVGELPGVDPTTGQSYADTAARSEEQARYASQLAYFESHQQQLYNMGINYNSLIAAAQQAHVSKMNAIDQSRRATQLAAAASIADSMTSIAEMALGKQSAAYKALFTISKGFAIAQASIAMYQNIAEAMKYGFPQNLPFIAAAVAQGATIIASIQAVAANFADGGLVRGPGGPRDDAIPANLSAGEYVIKAAAVSRPGNKALLDAINSGNMTARSRQARNDNSVAAAAGGGDTISLSFGDVVVQTGGGVSGSDGQAIGRDVKQALSELVDERLRTAQRPGGQLTRTRQSVVG